MTDELGRIIQTLVPDLGEPEGEARPLEGGITNRNYLVTLGGTAVAVEIFGSWIDGEVAAEPLFDPKGERIRA